MEERQGKRNHVIVGILQARVSSSRLPGKVLRPILGRPMLELQIERLRRARSLDKIVLATSIATEDDAIASLANEMGIGCWRGSLHDVLDRFIGAARAYHAAEVVRLTGDCPLADPEVIDAVVATYNKSNADYASNVNPPTFPDGLDVEVMSAAVLERAWREAKKPSEREHVTLYIHQRCDEFRIANYTAPCDLSALRWTVDHIEDFAFVTEVYEALYRQKPEFTSADILALLTRRPELARGNAHILRNEGLARSLGKGLGK
jgi:spore coat polysaccharide biosynthesis protein SpsF